MIREAIAALAEEGRDLGEDEAAAAMAGIVQMEAAGPDGASVTLDALVDTGATYTLAPASVLRRLGVEPIGRQTFHVADGSRVEREIGWLLVRIGGEERPTVVVFGDEGADALIGAVTLEEFGLGVDPVGRRLVPVDGYLVGLRPGGAR